MTFPTDSSQCSEYESAGSTLETPPNPKSRSVAHNVDSSLIAKAHRASHHHLNSNVDQFRNSNQSDDLITTFFLSNLHCPSCVGTITRTLMMLDPPPTTLSTSIVSHSLVVNHPSELTRQIISNALEAEGFEIHSIFEKRPGQTREILVVPPRAIDEAGWESSLERAVARCKSWKVKKMISPPSKDMAVSSESRPLLANMSSSDDDSTVAKMDKHSQNCVECQVDAGLKLPINSEMYKSDSSDVSSSDAKSPKMSAIPKDENLSHGTANLSDSSLSKDVNFILMDTPSTTSSYRLVLSISGMTCSACVGCITRAVEELAYIRSIDVSLLTHSAVTVFDGKHRLEEILSTVKQTGFDCSVLSLDEVESTDKRRTKIAEGGGDIWKATYIICGMTCAACVASLTNVLTQLTFIEQVNINLIESSGIIVFKDKTNLVKITDTIKDAGFEPVFQNVVNALIAEEMNVQRTVFIRIDGMYCRHCSTKIVDAFEKMFKNEVSFQKIATLNDPVFKIKYSPRPGEFTIRTILEFITSIDPIFRPSIFHPPTIEDRSRDLQRKDRLQILIRITLCSIIAIPAFIIGIVCDMLLDENNPARKFMSKPLWISTVSRSTWALFFLSTPVYFFAADMYHRKAWGEIRSMWRRGSKVPILNRFIRFGSMNLLMSLGTTIAYFSSILELILSAIRDAEVRKHHGMLKYPSFGNSHDQHPMLASKVVPRWVHLSHSQVSVALPSMDRNVQLFQHFEPSNALALNNQPQNTEFEGCDFDVSNLLSRSNRVIQAYETRSCRHTTLAKNFAPSNFPTGAMTMTPEPVDSMATGRTYYFDSVIFLMLFLLIGRFLEAYSKAKTGDAVTKLGRLRPKEATLIEGNDYSGVKVSIDWIDVGDIVRVHVGGTPPMDGIVVEGRSKFNESSLTGESRPADKSIGDMVYSGTVNIGGPIDMRVTSTEGSSMLDQIIRVVREGQTRRAPVERAADIITSQFVPVVILIAMVTWAVWFSLGKCGFLQDDYVDSTDEGYALWSLRFAIAVFVIACPCGIGLAAPTALFVGGGLAAQHGILVKSGGEAFQEASSLNIVVFDKTGTLTEGGNPRVTESLILVEGYEQEIMIMAKKVESNSGHVIARAVLTYCDAELKKLKEKRNGTATSRRQNDLIEQTPGIHDTNVDKCIVKDDLQIEMVELVEVPGMGMEGIFMIKGNTGRWGSERGQEVRILMGNNRLLMKHLVSIDRNVQMILATWESLGRSVIIIAVKVVKSGKKTPVKQYSEEGSDSSGSKTVKLMSLNEEKDNDEAVKEEGEGFKVYGILGISDAIRKEARGVIKALQERNIDVWMLSGDNATTALAVAQQIGIPRGNVLAGVLPEEKAQKIRWLQNSKKNAHVSMVGDGINDSPALSAADVGIAIGSGSDIAMSSADFILIQSDLKAVLLLIDLARLVFRRVWFNFIWAAVYNILAMPIAAGVLYPFRANSKHIRLEPAWAALIMALSSVSVIASSLLLRSNIPGIGFRERCVKA